MKTPQKKAELIGKITLFGRDYVVAQSEGALVGLIGDCPLISLPLQDTSPDVLLSAIVDILHLDMQRQNACAADIHISLGDWDTAGKYPSEQYRQIVIERLLRDVGPVTCKEGCSELSLGDPAKVHVSMSKFLDNLASHQLRLQSILDAMEVLLEKAYLIHRVKFVESMWGVDKVLEEISPSKRILDDQDKTLQSIGKMVSQSNKATQRMAHRIKGGTLTSVAEGTYIVGTVIPEILGAYTKVREVVVVTLGNLAPLYRLDNIFKKHTKNSVSWSVPSNVLLEFSEAFRILLQFLLDTPGVDNGVVQPLEYIQKEIERNLSSTAVQR